MYNCTNVSLIWTRQSLKNKKTIIFRLPQQYSASVFGLQKEFWHGLLLYFAEFLKSSSPDSWNQKTKKWLDGGEVKVREKPEHGSREGRAVYVGLAIPGLSFHCRRCREMRYLHVHPHPFCVRYSNFQQEPLN